MEYKKILIFLILLKECATFNATFKYSTKKGKYCFTFPGLLLNKYRILFFGKQDIIYCMPMAIALEN